MDPNKMVGTYHLDSLHQLSQWWQVVQLDITYTLCEKQDKNRITLWFTISISYKKVMWFSHSDKTGKVLNNYILKSMWTHDYCITPLCGSSTKLF